ncbi:hypothetical protein BCV70DRAFT_199709 [Testicularia cyperi]|uniref:Uncharacterized protein n=1 Tax=Testicularia cyperi TaxID=1882483 RepID=A0A317XSV6_9BASI|nr:hypothetical protein BCV70DRAFT_199709 [Testicularia cyperi]
MTGEPHRKRRRYSGGASLQNSDENFGVQSLPVAELPADFDGVPLDGEQYLAVVRREAASGPNVFHAKHNPYATAAGSAVSTQLSDRASTLESGTSIEAELQLPSKVWQQQFLAQYRNMRESLSNAPLERVGCQPDRLPKPSNAVGWYIWIHGKAPPDDQQRGCRNQRSSEAWKIKEPSGAQVLRLSTDQILGILEAFPFWLGHRIEVPDTLSQEYEQDSSASGRSVCQQPVLQPLHSRWLFALLAHLDSRLLSEQISVLRTLARACIAAVALSRIRRKALQSRKGSKSASTISSTDSNESENEVEQALESTGSNTRRLKDETTRLEAGAWMVLTIVAGIWGQSDLWDDALSDLRRVA